MTRKIYKQLITFFNHKYIGENKMTNININENKTKTWLIDWVNSQSENKTKTWVMDWINHCSKESDNKD